MKWQHFGENQLSELGGGRGVLHNSTAQFVIVTVCDVVAICDGKSRDLLWVSRFVRVIVALCDNVKICVFRTYI